MSLLLADKISSFLSVNRSAKLQIISLLCQHNTPNSQKEHFTHPPTRGQCFPISWQQLPGPGAERPGFVHSYVLLLSAAPQLDLIKGRYRLHSMCTKLTVKNYCYCTAAALLELENRNTSCCATICNFSNAASMSRSKKNIGCWWRKCEPQVNSPAGLISEKKVPTFLPSTMSVMTWPVTFGWVPFAITTEVPPWRAQRAALTYRKTHKQTHRYESLNLKKKGWETKWLDENFSTL